MKKQPFEGSMTFVLVKTNISSFFASSFSLKPCYMKQFSFCLLLTLCFFSSAHSQIDFEPGYFIHNSGERTDCLIRNVDWQYNPTKFDYKLTENSAVQTGKLESVKEFSVTNEFKYIRATVNMDLSSNSVNHLSDSKEPNFEEETIFLKVLVEGKATLFGYQRNVYHKYFFQVESSEIEQLIFKRYLTSTYVENKNTYIRERFKDKRGIAENNWYKQQIWNSLKCDDISKNRIEKLKYQSKELSKVYIDFNTCGQE